VDILIECGISMQRSSSGAHGIQREHHANFEEENEMRLRDRVAIVTGSGSGLGKAMALALSREGAKIVINDIESQFIEEAVNQIRDTGGIALGVICDVSKPAEVQAMVNSCLKEFGQVDILVNNAGGCAEDIGDRFLQGLPHEKWQRMMEVNLNGTIHCSIAVIPHMIKMKYGKIINISSQAGRFGSELAGPCYSAAKAGQLGFTRQMAVTLGPHGINVNAITPGVMISGPRVDSMWLAHSEEARQEKLNKIPLRRLGTAEEVASVVVFLASEESSYITGATIDVNGGRFMG
jgi:3-oxoacyl-[acyl-carrier protein] reductase